ncbi:MAG: enolase C-terminal domain-like protein [Acetobacteraceae bacterium]|nr:enolase C-terminal domain-like protein [Acetobacteraceae bacterium]MDI3309654.1 enolase C-terminal domain-like protein [Acetobacteraceae bacterium]
MRAPGTIRRIRLRRVRLPLGMAYVSSMYVMDSTERTVIEVETESGITGLGETLGYAECFAHAARLARGLLGRDAADRQGFRRSFGRSVFDNRNGRIGWSAYAGLDLALWDIAGKALDRPLAALLGGAVRHRIPLACPLPAVALDRPASRAGIAAIYRDHSRAKALGEQAAALASRHGFRAFKYKSAGTDAGWDVAAMAALRHALGPEAAIRFDPNAAWPTACAVELAEALRPHAPEWLEDPCDDREGLWRLRLATGVTVATNMAVIQPDHIAAAVRQPCADVWLADLFMWGGIEGWRDMAATAALFGVEVALHSLFETGIATAANLHLAAAHAQVTRATDCGAVWLKHDVVTPALAVRDGMLDLPSGPGLGVGLDPAAMAEATVEERVIEP